MPQPAAGLGARPPARFGSRRGTRRPGRRQQPRPPGARRRGTGDMNRASDPTTHVPVGESFEPADGERSVAGAAIPTSRNTAHRRAQVGGRLGGTIGHHVNPTPCHSPTRPPGRLSSTGGRNGTISRAPCALFILPRFARQGRGRPAGAATIPQGKDSAMNEVRLDPRQAPARTELLLAASFGQQARGRPIHGRLESEDAIMRWLAGQEAERRSAPAKPRSRAARRRWRRALARKAGRA